MKLLVNYSFLSFYILFSLYSHPSTNRSLSLYPAVFNIIHPNKEVLYNASDSDNPDKIAVRKLNALYNQIFTFAPPTLIVF